MERVAPSRAAGTLIDAPDVTQEELQLAVRNHSMPLEAMRYDITPIGMHYLLIHFDVPAVDEATYELAVGGLVRKPLRLPLDAVKRRPAKTLPVTLECAGNGRARMTPRPMSQPWLNEAVGTAEWTGTPLAPLLEEAGVDRAASEVVFTGLDRGVQGDVDQWYERSLTIADAMRPEVMLAYAINGRPLPPQHGFPLRLVVPGWYGMTSVKWLRSITVVERPFEGYQQARAYHYRTEDADEGVPVTRILPRALMIPPGHPDFMSRTRFVGAGVNTIEGRAWSGRGAVVGVDFSADGGITWTAAKLEPPLSDFAWRRWSVEWLAAPGRHELCVRARDDAGNEQPLAPPWNLEGVQNNAVQRVSVVAGAAHEEQKPAG